MFNVEVFKPKKTKTMYKNIRDITLAIILLVTAVPLSGVNAQSQQELRNRINNLDSQIDQGENHLHNLAQEADTLEQYINELNSDIAEIQSQISATRNNIASTEEQIAEAEAELKRQQEIMDESIRTLYKQGNVSTVELIAASENFSDFINQQEYIERVKINVAEAAEKVKELQAELEQKNEELNKLLAKQEGQRQIVVNKRRERQEALEYTRGQEARYAAYVENLEAKKAEAQQDLQDLIARLSQQAVFGAYVQQGQIVGRIGNTGYATTGPHLHYEVRNGYGPVNPVESYSERTLKWGFQWPADPSFVVSSGYECRYYPTRGQGSCPPGMFMHYGVDVAPTCGCSGDLVYATGSGRVATGFDPAGGNYVIIEHDNGLRSYYFHLAG